MFENLKNYVFDNEYIVSFMNDKVHIYNYESINIFDDKKIQINFNDKNILINGKDLLIKKMDKKEILIYGNVYDMKFR